MLVEGIAVGQALSGFVQCVVANEQVGYEVDEEQLPGGQRELVFYPGGCD
jgi:hypothetical protein